MTLPFSKRGKPPKDVLSYEIPLMVRNRIHHYIEALMSPWPGRLGEIYTSVGKKCLLAYGGMCRANHGVWHTGRTEADDAFDHFRVCPDDIAIDFIEWCFQARAFFTGPEGVEAINNIFREEGIGYEFTPFVTEKVEYEKYGKKQTYEEIRKYPEATKKTNELLHASVVMPALHLLSHPKFKVANDEMLKAHEHFRKGDLEAAVVACGQSFETVFKTICTEKKWKYDPDKDTLSALVQACSKNGLFPTFYNEVFVNQAGKIRNKRGGHGKGPQPIHGDMTAEEVGHMIQVTSAHILYVGKLANL